MIVNKQKTNLFRWLKRLDETCKDIGKLLEEEMGNYDDKLEKIESKLFKYEDKIMMLECKLNEKNKAFQENVRTDLTKYHDEHEKELRDQREKLTARIKEVEVQLITKEDQIRSLELDINEKTKMLHDKIKNFQDGETVENNKVNAAFKVELDVVKTKVHIHENKLVALIDGSNKKVYKQKKTSESLTKCDHCDKTFISNTDLEAHIDSDHEITAFKCEKCENVFVSKWRLKMHKQLHTQTHKTRNCHYFNSGKVCPFEKLGCKFKHVLSADCKHGAQCTVSMCQFKH